MKKRLDITTKFLNKTTTIKRIWQCATAGRANEGLRNDWQRQLRIFKKEIGCDYIRFHGIYHDDMMIYNEDKLGNPYFNFQYFDTLFDFLKEIDIVPIFEISFTPSLLKSDERTVFWWKGKICPPKDYDKYCEMVKQTILHAINRYGLNEVLRWRFEVWNEPVSNALFWSGNFEQYAELYESLVKTIKSINKDLKVGGPASPGWVNGEAPVMKQFIGYCQEKNLPIDFITAHPYPVDFSTDKDGMTYMSLKGRDSTENDVKWLCDLIENSAYKGKVEIHLTEWNSSPCDRDLVHDTAFMAPCIIDNMVKCIGLVDSLGFWTFTDVFEESAAGSTIFHGGFGLINYQGLKKSSYNAFWMLSKLGSQMIDKGNDYIITKKQDSIQILFWNYNHYTDKFARGDSPDEKPSDRYSAFQNENMPVFIHVELPTDNYKVTTYLLDREHGSVYDAWVKNGAVAYPDRDDIEILRQNMVPKGEIRLISNASEYEQNIELKEHAVVLIEIKKRYE